MAMKDDAVVQSWKIVGVTVFAAVCVICYTYVQATEAEHPQQSYVNFTLPDVNHNCTSEVK